MVEGSGGSASASSQSTISSDPKFGLTKLTVQPTERTLEEPLGGSGLASISFSAQLPVPPVAFPTPVNSKSTTKALTNAQKLTKALKLCKKDRSRAQKAKCEKGAHSKYGPVIVNTNAKGRKHAGGKKHG